MYAPLTSVKMLFLAVTSRAAPEKIIFIYTPVLTHVNRVYANGKI